MGSEAEVTVSRGRCEAGEHLSGAGGARCSSNVKFWSEVYVPLESEKYMFMFKKEMLSV